MEALEVRYNELFKLFNSMINENKSGDESGVLKSLMNLQQKIDERKKEVDQKASRIKGKKYSEYFYLINERNLY